MVHRWQRTFSNRAMWAPATSCMQFQNRPIPEEHTAKILNSHHLNSCSQFFVVVVITNFTLFAFECIIILSQIFNFTEWMNQQTNVLWLASFHPFVFRSTIFLHKYHFHSVCTLLWFQSVTNVLTEHPNTLNRFFFQFVLVWFLWILLPFIRFAFKWVYFSNSKTTVQYCTSNSNAMFIRLCRVFSCVCVYASEMLSTPTAFYEWFFEFCWFFSRPKIFMFPQFYMFTRIVFSNFCSRKWNYSLGSVHVLNKKSHTTIKPTELITEFFLFTLFSLRFILFLCECVLAIDSRLYVHFFRRLGMTTADSLLAGDWI